jgi:hypothetical protein
LFNEENSNYEELIKTKSHLVFKNEFTDNFLFWTFLVNSVALIVFGIFEDFGKVWCFSSNNFVRAA